LPICEAAFKRQAYLRSILLSAIFILCGCSGHLSVPVPGGSPLQKAARARLPGTLTVKLSSAETMWLAVSAPDAGYVNIREQKTKQTLPLNIIYAQSATSGQSRGLNVLRQGKFLPDACYLPQAGLFFIGLKLPGPKSPSRAYKLQLEFFAPIDRYESNDEPVQATEVSLDEELQIAIFPREDTDWFKLALPAGGCLVIHGLDIPAGISVRARIFQKANTAAPLLLLSESQTLPAIVRIAKAQDYYVQLLAGNPSSYSSLPFKISLNYLSEMDAFEPNDTFAQAKTLILPCQIVLALFPSGDRDYFRILTGQTYKISISADEFLKLAPEAVLFQKQGDAFGQGSDVKRLPAEFDVAPNSEYYLCLQEDIDNTASPQLFNVNITAH
jgi:hypothetical protein